MITHMRSSLTKGPVCWGKDRKFEAMQTSKNVDNVDCVDCLRKLVKSAAQYGNERRVARKSAYGKKL